MALTKNIKFLGLLFMLISFFWGCAGPKVKPIVWPGPPDVPRIKFVKSFTTPTDLFGASFTDALLGEGGGGGLRKPNGIHVDKEGTIYISDTELGIVHIFDIKNKKKRFITGLSKPIGIATDSTGKVYVSDTSIDRVMIYNKDGEFISSIGNPKELKQPAGIAINQKLKRIYIVDTHNHNVAVYSIKTRKRLFEFGERGSEEGQFNFPSHLTIDKEDRVWIVDTINGRVESFDADGNFLDTFGRLGDAPGSFARPKGIGVDSEGHIYVVDSAFNNVQIFNDEGQIMLGFSGYGDSKAMMILPADLTIDSEDRIYVVDQWNFRVNIFQYLGERYWKKYPKDKKLLFKGVDEEGSLDEETGSEGEV